MKGNRSSVAAVVLSATLLLGGCAGEPPTVTDTGYNGTWTRGSERVRTELEIWGDDESGYRLRWRLTSADGDREVRCTWDGRCVEQYEGEITAEHTLRTELVDGRLHLTTQTTVHGDAAREDTMVDEFRVRSKGTILRAVTLERNGQPVDGRKPRRIYRKISDSVDTNGLTP